MAASVPNSVGFLSAMAAAEEDVPGTAETVPVIYDYFTGDPSLNPVQNVIMGGNVQLRESVKHAAGGFHMTGNFPIMVEPAGILGWLLKWGIGACESAVNTSTSYTHTYTPSDTLYAFTLWVMRSGNHTVKVPYCMVNRMEFVQAVDDSLRCNWSIFGQKETTAADFGTASYSALSPFMNHHLTVSISGATTGQASEVFNTSIVFDNGIDVNLGKVHGSRFYQELVPGKRKVTGSMQMYFADKTEYQKFWGTSSSTTVENALTEVPLIFTWDTGIEIETSYNYKLTITIPEAVYTSTTMNLGGGRVVQTIGFEAEYDAGDEYEVLVELVNTDASYPDAS